MIKYCCFKPFDNGKKYLLTNDTGNYIFLDSDTFKQYISDSLPIDSEIGKIMADKYFLSDEHEEVFTRRIEQSIRDSRNYLLMPTSLFIFAVTNICNARCIYCQARGCTNESSMNKETAIKSLERIAESPAKNLTIEFQGGEPLANFDVIHEIVKRSREIMPGKNISFALVSNLSMINDSIADFICENKISVSTSLDGPKKLHDKNRPLFDGKSSYDAMIQGRKILSERGIKTGAIQTTTRASLNYAREIVREYISLGYNSIFLRPLTRIGAALLQWDKIGYTPDEYIRFYRTALDEIITLNKSGVKISERFSALLLRKMFGYPAQNYMELRSPCGAGVGQLAFTPSGDVYTCDEGRMLAEMGDKNFRLGNVFNDGYSDWMNNITCKAVLSASLLETLPSCINCVYQPYCGVCPVINYAVEGDLRSRSPHNERCKIYSGILDSIMELLMNNDPEITEIFNDWARES